MPVRALLSAAAAASLIILPAERASADAGDFFAGAIAGAIMNHAARNAQPKRTYRSTPKRTAKKKTPSRPRIPATQEGKQIQSALNYFGFNAGGVDGQLGKRSRAAISAYQAYMGYAPTGNLSPFEQELLVSSHMRAQAGGANTHMMVAQTPDGTRGLLKRFRTEMAGQAMPGQMVAAPGQMVMPMPAQPGTTVVVAPIAPPAAAAAVAAAPAALAAAQTFKDEADVAEAKAEEDVGLPSLFGSTAQEASLASHCNKVSLLTSSNGGFTTLATMSDPDTALSEQFCLARIYAIDEGEQIAAKVGAPAEQIAQHCGIYAEKLEPFVAALSIKQTGDVIRDVSAFVLSAGVSTQDLEGTARVCLSTGYRTDDMDMALGSTLLLVTLGQKAYGELLGHHLAQGYGTATRPDLAGAWYEMGLSAAESGQGVFAPGQPERAALIRAAVSGEMPQSQEDTPVQANLPVFSIDQ